MYLEKVIDIFLHLDVYLDALMAQYGIWAYLLLGLIIFMETGLVVTPFLPGDSLIFATGALAAIGGGIPIPLVLALLYVAAIGGDTVNYQIGHLLREKVQRRERIPLIKMEYIDRTHAFFEKNGGKTVTIARFIPIIRTFAPFVAGVGEMSYRWFLSYNVIGGVLWVSVFFSIGYFFGNNPYIKAHFSLVVLAIVAISVLPAVVAVVRSHLQKRTGASK